MQHRILDGCGRCVWLLVSAQIIQKTDRAVYFLTFTDITADKKQADSLLVTQKDYRTALQKAEVDIWDYDMEHRSITRKCYMEDGSCIDRVVCDIPESVIGYGYIHPDSVEKYRGLYARLHLGEKEPFADILGKDDEGASSEWRWKRLRYMTVSDRDTIKRAIGVGLDITEQKAAEDRFQSELAYREEMFKDKNILSMRLNLTTNVIEHASHQYQLILQANYSYDNFINNLISSSIPEETQRARFIETFARENLLNSYKAGESSIQCEYQRFMPDGTLKWVTTVIKMLAKPHTNETIAFTTTADTDMEHISKELLEKVASQDYDYVIYLDAKNNSYRMFASDSKNTPLPPQICYVYESALKIHAYKYVIPEDIEYTIQCMLLKNLFEQLEKNDVYEFTVSSVEKDGSVRMKKVKYSYLDKKNKIMILSRTDVTDLYRQLQEYNKLRELANKDSLTGLYNKNYFYANLAREIGTPDAKWIFFIDLDDFKRVNDKLGHLMGDRIIRGVANILRGIFGEEAVVGRFGGDEFFVLLKNVSERIVRDRAEEICSSLCFRYDNNAKRVAVHASVGVFFFKEKIEVETVMHCADEALYQAKAMGKSKYVLYHEIINHIPTGNAPRLSRGQ